MQNYVAGFPFDELESYVILINKKRPSWQAGFLNGVGGKIEDGESPIDAMIREFKEEAGVVVDDWRRFAILETEHQSMVHFFMAKRPIKLVWNLESQTDELLGLVRVTSLPPNVVPNLNWLIPMAIAPAGLLTGLPETFCIKEAKV